MWGPSVVLPSFRNPPWTSSLWLISGEVVGKWHATANGNSHPSNISQWEHLYENEIKVIWKSRRFGNQITIFILKMPETKPIHQVVIAQAIWDGRTNKLPPHKNWLGNLFTIICLYIFINSQYSLKFRVKKYQWTELI